MGRWLLVSLGFIAGLLLLVAGAAMSQLWLGVIGFLLMFGAVAFAFAVPQAPSGPTGVVQPDGRVSARGGKRGVRPSTSRPGFMARLEERWDRRRHEGR